MASPGDDAKTQQNTKEEKPDVQNLQIIVKAQVRSVNLWPLLLYQSDVCCTRPTPVRNSPGACIGRFGTAVSDKTQHPFAKGATLFTECELRKHGLLTVKSCESCTFMQVFNAYAQKKSLQLADCKFVCDGNILNGTQTAEEVMLLSCLILLL